MPSVSDNFASSADNDGEGATMPTAFIGLLTAAPHSVLMATMPKVSQTAIIITYDGVAAAGNGAN